MIGEGDGVSASILIEYDLFSNETTIRVSVFGNPNDAVFRKTISGKLDCTTLDSMDIPLFNDGSDHCDFGAASVELTAV
jgi:hypothetical protein